VKVAALYDIHGNLHALDAVLAEADQRGAELILVGGDVASGPMPRETLERLAARGDQVRYIRGNADRSLAGALARPPVAGEPPWAKLERWAAERLTPGQREWLANLPTIAMIEIAGLGQVLFCHGTPRSDEEILTRLTPDEVVLEALTGTDAPLVVCGHTHVQYDRQIGNRRIVNAGSVGMPYEGEPSARWALLGLELTLMRTPYDVVAAGADIRAGGHPDAEGFVRRFLITPFTAEEASATFEQQAAASRAAKRKAEAGGAA